MCGILGAMGGPARALTNAAVRNSLRGLSHRGPDDEGIAAVVGDSIRLYSLEQTLPALGHAPFPHAGRLSADVLLGHRRLSIIDLSAGGHQPMVSPTGRYTVVFNGEIYNYRELRDRLRDQGHSFRTESDTEVLLTALEVWGSIAFERCEGMFAVAAYDRASRALMLARDRFGIKPLYYWRSTAGVVFASEVRAVRSLLTETSFGLNRDVARAYLLQGTSDSNSQTFFADIEQLLPGELLTVTREGIHRTSWLPVVETVETRGSYDERKGAVRDALFQSVELHLRADVPVGVCLSGGVDSSLLVAITREILGARHDIVSFSYVADGSSASEEPFIDLVSQRFGTDSRKCRVDFRQLLDRTGELQTLLSSLDEPVISTSVVAQQSVYRLARDAGIRVVLDGQGSDELFAGYADYASVRLAELLRGGHLSAVTSLVRSLAASHEVTRAAMGFVLALPSPVLRAVAEWASNGLRGAWVKQDDGHELSSRALLNTHLPNLQQTLVASRAVAPLPALLRFADRSSMLASVESRVPFLSSLVSDVVRCLPPDDLVRRDGVRKAILRDLARDLLPPVVIDRPKIGFAVPNELWAKPLAAWDDWSLQFAAGPGASLLDYDGVHQLLGRARSGSARAQNAAWRLLNFAIWATESRVRIEPQ